VTPTRVFAIRHGESTWNVLRAKYSKEEDRYHPRMYTPDCGITTKGIEQSRQAGHALSKELLGEDEFLLITSPLKRALQTSHYALQTCLQKATSIIVHPAATEVMTDACDIGTEATSLEAEFPNYDYKLLKKADNPYWWPHGKSIEETWERMRTGQPEGIESEEMCQLRLREFQDFIKSCSSKVIVVVCHSEIIWWITSKMKQGERFGIWTSNGECIDISHSILGESLDF